LTAIVVSVIDFIDHVTRTESSYFRDNWSKWFLFTFASTITLCTSIYFINIVIKRLIKTENILSQSGAIAVAILIHTYLSGPVYDRLIFGEATLTFFLNPITFVIALGTFYMIRLLTHVAIKLSARGEQQVLVDVELTQRQTNGPGAISAKEE
jgi:hypothetical protein